MRKIAITLLVALSLVGCSSESTNSDGEPEAKVTEEAAASPLEETAEPYVPQAPAPVTVEITCLDESYTSHSYYSPKEAWPTKYDSCEGNATDGELTKLETRAVKAAYADAGDTRNLGTLYGLCAQNGPESWNYLDTAGSPEQIAEVKGALVLCPDHPQRKKIGKALGGADRRNELESEGRAFGGGVFQVGKEIKPGTYYTSDVENCYWERTDANGEAIDNYFTNAAKRVQVTIRPSDYTFNSESCGQWQPVGP
ncbi:hypothetical protein [Streptomyces albipurpureus]|uniref:Lipoprotein n=1 Tax=Streptomyces albipurpureus TaxID=2897419 RepID=A0ABT0UZB4_9ACTN|nr:hypothetical protein [Streptomyces sp. CWNU-1]MCM2393918.1 hypothetical protein [Streptomyces sp. CWNU-1]